MTRAWLVNVVVAVLCACAVALTAFTIREYFFAPPVALTHAVSVPTWRKFAMVGERLGPRDAPVIIVEFSDFQCPVCRRLHSILVDLQSTHKAVAVIYRHYPLEGHPYARDAARASVCAASQNRFQAFHDTLFAQPLSLGKTPWTVLASEAGVSDTAEFSRCMRSTMPDAIVDRDIKAGNDLGVIGTPTLLVNSWMYEGIPPDLPAVVSAALDHPNPVGN